MKLDAIPMQIHLQIVEDTASKGLLSKADALTSF